MPRSSQSQASKNSTSLSQPKSARDSGANRGGTQAKDLAKRTQKKQMEEVPSLNEASSSKGKKRKPKERDDEDELASERPVKYQIIRERVRRVPIAVIESKWRTLPQTIQDQVHELLRLSKMSILNQEEGKRKATDVKTILDKVVRRLEDADRKVKFPVKKDMQFDVEKVGEQNAVLANQLTTAQHSVALLEAEIEATNNLLERDRRFLTTLAKDAKTVQREQQRQKIKMHPLLREFAESEALNDDVESINLVRSKNGRASADTNGSDLEPLVRQLQQHLTNMASNARQAEGIGEAIASARVLLEDISCRHSHLKPFSEILAG